MHFVDAKGILSAKNGMNLYRGCTHGCIYCDARSACYQMNHSFEDIEVKRNAPELLEAALRKKRRRCMISTGAMCDPYLHAEAELGLTRRCLEIIARHGFGAAILTKSDLVLRDLDLLVRINEQAKCVVQMTLTTFDEALCRIVEPGVCTTARRAEVLRILRAHGIPTVVWLTPTLPMLNDTEENLRGILAYCADAGVRGIVNFGFGVTLREGDREYFYAALDRHFPGLRAQFHRRYGNAYECDSGSAPQLWRIFDEFCEAHGMLYRAEEIFRWMDELPEAHEQLSFF